MRTLLYSLLSVALCLCSAACGGSDAPLDADTRQLIDSTANAQIRLARAEIDTLCAQRERTELPRLIDSFKQARQREIEEQLKTVPR